VALIAGLLAALFFMPRPWLAVLIGMLAGLGGFEWARLCGLQAVAAFAYASLITAAYVALLLAGEMAWQAALLGSGVFWVLAVPAWLWHGIPSPGAKLLAPAGFLVIVPAALAIALMRPPELLAVLILVWIADTAAYFVGRAFGRHRLAPSISPAKTWEGAAGGLIGALAYAIICGTFIEGLAWAPYLAAAALLAVLSIVGDLFESAAKRQAGVKDSGALLPGHGGLLDRIDSAVATLPLAALLLPFIKGQP
jgi:phosphatidate cytidylyltransferase